MNYIIFGRTVQLANFPCSRWQHWNNKQHPRKELFKFTKKPTSGFGRRFGRLKMCFVCMDVKLLYIVSYGLPVKECCNQSFSPFISGYQVLNFTVKKLLQKKIICQKEKSPISRARFFMPTDRQTELFEQTLRTRPKLTTLTVIDISVAMSKFPLNIYMGKLITGVHIFHNTC